MEKNPKHQILRPHAILVPYPLQGHVIPFVHLATKLASEGFTITFINTESVHHQIIRSRSDSPDDDDIFIEARKSGLDIRYTTVSDGFPMEFDRSLNHDRFFEFIMDGFGEYVDEVVEGLVRTSNPTLTCLVADTFYVWASKVADRYGLVNVSFWTEPALVLTLYYHMDLLIKHGHYASSDNRKDTIGYIPGVEAIEPEDMPSYLQTHPSTVVHKIIHKAFEDIKRADFIICNTVYELEPATLKPLHERQPTYAIGPIFPLQFTESLVGTSLWSESDCTQWLDTKPPGSVLYVSFGSYAHTTKDDITEIALGLLESKVNFIWVLRKDIISSDEVDFLPVGFEENVRGRGVIMTWSCQKRVISHPAIGGFLTHCGWNSILESTWCTVPLLCHPLLTDQFTNRKLVVDDWGIGLNLCDGKKVNREEVSAKISRLMSGESADQLRRNLGQVKRTLGDALSKDGSSRKNFDHFISDAKAKMKIKQK